MARVINAIKQMFGFHAKEQFVKLVGTDRFQNKFFERLPGNEYYEKSSRRFYEPADLGNVRIHIDPAWEAWLRGTRKEPPTTKETLAQEHRRQQLSEQPVNMLPTSYGLESAQGGKGSYPIRENYEINPGVKSGVKQDPNETH